MDCPAITEGAYSDYVYLYQFAGDTTGTCDPLRGTQATVACGTLTGPGALVHALHCSKYQRMLQCDNRSITQHLAREV